MTTVFASAADARYGYHLVNLLASVRRNSDVFDRIVVHDLGLTPHQRSLVELLPGVELRDVPHFAPHWSQGFTWKPWIWTHLEADAVFYLDAGATVLRSLEPALRQVTELGYFAVSQGNALRDLVPADYYALYGLDPALGDRPYVAAGIVGFRTEGEFWERVVVPTYEDCLAGRSVGFSTDDAQRRNFGLAHEDAPPIRDCATFRWDQTILNIHLAQALPGAVLGDMAEYAGARTPHEHPRQVIWAHRMRGDLRYLKRAPYVGPGAVRARIFGARYQLRWWRKLHEKWFMRSTYEWKLRSIAQSLRNA
ncbi:MAG TPA: hypothetical protein VIE38_00880 [Gaiellaceae bacterium]|jgi:hypothetical protein